MFSNFKKLSYFFFLLFPFCVSLTPKKSEMQSVSGKILESYVDKKHKYRSIYIGHTDFQPFIKYEYEVDGKKYFSERISYWNHLYNSRSKAEAVIIPYQVGNEIPVFYKKENPEESYLEVEDDQKEEED